MCGGGGVVKIQLFNLVVLLVGSIGASMPNFSFLEGVILTIPGGVGRWGELRNKTKLRPSSVKLELELGKNMKQAYVL